MDILIDYKRYFDFIKRENTGNENFILEYKQK